jgi:CheY-like chemotaxis protein
VEVLAVGDGAAAIARLDAEPPDVVLADIGMPGQDGYAVAKHVMQTPALAHIPVILLTGAFDPVDHARVREAGCAGVLVKPFDPQMLVARVRSLLEGRAAARPPAEVVSAPSDTPPAIPSPPLRAPAADVEDYFDRLDRAFAHLARASPTPDASAEPSGPDPSPEAHGAAVDSPAASLDVPSEPAAPVDATPEPGDRMAPDAGDETDLEAAPVGGEQSAHAEPTPVPAAAVPSATPGAPASIAANRTDAAPTLVDAFGALLALEQGGPLPETARGFASLLPSDLVERVAARVSREVAERVVRDLAPAIVSQLAERLVRDEIERLKTGPPLR